MHVCNATQPENGVQVRLFAAYMEIVVGHRECAAVWLWRLLHAHEMSE
jgi:hypothetical protein